MKNEQQTSNSDINEMDDIELKALAKVFVEKAIKKGYNAIKIHQTIRELCMEYDKENNPNLPVAEVPEETEEEKEFREKATKFIGTHKKINRCRYSVKYRDKGEEKTTNATLEVLCAMNKIYCSGVIPTLKEVKKVVKQQLDPIKDSKYPVFSETNRAFYGIEEFAQKTIEANEELEEILKKHHCTRKSVFERYIVIIWAMNRQ